MLWFTGLWHHVSGLSNKCLQTYLFVDAVQWGCNDIIGTKLHLAGTNPQWTARGTGVCQAGDDDLGGCICCERLLVWCLGCLEKEWKRHEGIQSGTLNNCRLDDDNDKLYATGGKHIMFSYKWYTYSIYYTPSVKYPEVYVHPCTKSTGLRKWIVQLHEIPRCASHQGWSSRFLVTIGQGDSGIVVCCFFQGFILDGWCMVGGGAQDF